MYYCYRAIRWDVFAADLKLWEEVFCEGKLFSFSCYVPLIIDLISTSFTAAWALQLGIRIDICTQ